MRAGTPGTCGRAAETLRNSIPTPSFIKGDAAHSLARHPLPSFTRARASIAMGSTTKVSSSGSVGQVVIQSGSLCIGKFTVRVLQPSMKIAENQDPGRYL